MQLEIAQQRVGPVTFGGDFFVIVVIRLGARFARNLAGERVLARRLIKVAVKAQIDGSAILSPICLEQLEASARPATLRPVQDRAASGT